MNNFHALVGWIVLGVLAAYTGGALGIIAGVDLSDPQSAKPRWLSRCLNVLMAICLVCFIGAVVLALRLALSPWWP